MSEISILKRGAEIGKRDLKANSNGKEILLGYDVSKFCITPTKAKIDLNHKEYLRLRNFFEHSPLVLIRRVSKIIIAAVSDSPAAFSKNIYGLIPKDNINPHYLCALLNSKLLNFYYKNKFSTKKDNFFPELQIYFLEQLPIKIASEQVQKRILNIVDNISNEKINNPEFNTSELEKQIDQIVYELYGLSEDEISIIEGGI